MKNTLLFIFLFLVGRISFGQTKNVGTYHLTEESCAFGFDVWTKSRLTLNKDTTFIFELLVYTSPSNPKKKPQKPELDNYETAYGRWRVKGDTLILTRLPMDDDKLFWGDLIFENKKLFYVVSLHKKLAFHRESFPRFKKRIKKRQWQQSDNIGKSVIRN